MIFWLLLTSYVILFTSSHSNAQDPADAVVRLVPSGPDHLVNGHLTIKQCEDGILVQGTVSGLTPGFHGFHVHQKGDLANGCKAAGGHFNPFGKTHGDPRSNIRHVGDLGNIWANSQGVAQVDFFDGLSSLDSLSRAYIGKRSIVIHTGPDDLGRGRNEESLKTGNAGVRVACGIIDDSPTGEFVQQSAIVEPRNCKPKLASSQIVTGNSAIPVEGHLRLTQASQGILTIQGFISGLTPGRHGMHIHAVGNLGNACSDAGGHFNPHGRNHGHPRDAFRHVGDLGNIVADETGTASVHIVDHEASLEKSSKAYIGGLAFVVHALPDDLGRGQNEESLKTGNAGGRVGCGLIIVEEDQPTDAFEPSLPSFVRDSLTQIVQEPVKPIQQITVKQPIIFHNPATQHHNYNPSTTDFRMARTARVILVPANQNPIEGSLKISERNFGVFIEGHISGLSPGPHGFHVHKFGATGNNCLDAGGHFNPLQKDHGHPNSLNRHVGDMGNIVAANNGIAKLAIYDSHASLDPSSLAYIGHKAIVVHQGVDDLGRGRNAESLKTGNAGPRLACGVIQVDQSSGGSLQFESQRSEAVPVASAGEAIRPIIADVTIKSGSVPGVSGVLILRESGPGVFLEGKIVGLSPGNHGFHVHEKGLLTNNCVDAGGHFNPLKKTHGAPNQSNRHVGDIGNIFADSNGVARIGIFDSHPSLDPQSEAYIGGRAIVIHAGEDDLGAGGNEESLKTGNAGSRVGCGLIRIRSPEARQALAKPDEFYHFSSGSFYPPFSESDAMVSISPATTGDFVTGFLELRRQSYGVAITGILTGLSPGKHGFHIHEFADLGDACVNAGGHFNPFKLNHGNPRDGNRHIGDLGNVVADREGKAIVHIIDDQISLHPNEPSYVGNGAFVIHEKADDLGLGPDLESLKTGNAGRRVACGVITVNPKIFRNPIQFPS